MRRVKMNYKADFYGMLRNVLTFIALVIGIFTDNWDFVIAFMLYNISAGLTDIAVNLKER